MTIGTLWFDDDPTHTLDEKVQAACGRYWIKFGIQANTCYVHPSEVRPGLTTVMTSGGSAHVVAAKGTLPHHYFAVREDD